MTLSEEELKNIIAHNPSLAKRNPYLLSNGLQQVEEKQPEKVAETKRGPKYRNTKIYVYDDNYACLSNHETGHGKIATVFDSKKEYNRWNELLSLEQAGRITDLRRQVKLQIQEAFDYKGEPVKEIYYSADFIYKENGETIVEDVKGYSAKTDTYIETKDFRLKWKLLKYRYPEYNFKVV